MSDSGSPPREEPARLAAVASYRTAAGSPAQPAFDEIVRLAAHVVGTPMAGLCLVEADRLVWKAEAGFSRGESPREGSFCSATILQDTILVVGDAAADPRFAQHALVTGPSQVRFYAGAPLRAPSGHKVGTLSVFDRIPRQLDAEQAHALAALARAAVAQFELQRSYQELQKAAADRDRSENALRAERDLVARIAETSPAGIAVVDRAGQIVFANLRAEQLLGLARSQIRERHFDAPEWRHTDFEGRPFPAEKLPVRQVLDSKLSVFGVQHAIEWPDGRRVCLSVNAAPLRDARGEVEAVVATFEDVTQAVQALQALKVTKDAVSSSLSGIAFADRNGRLSDVNPAFLRLWGYSSRDDVIGRDVSEFWEDPAAARAVIESLNAQRGWSGEIEARRPDGSSFDALVAANLIRDGNGQAVGMMASFIDLTAQKHFERTVRQVVEGASGHVGEHFLDAIVLELAAALEMDFVFVGQLAPDEPLRVDTLAFCAQGAIAPPFTYHLRGTPCETVIGRQVSTYPSGVRESFPEDRALFDLEVEGYIGVPLFSTSGHPLGILVALRRRPIPDPDFAAAILSLFAARTAAEIERTRALKDLERSERTSRSIVESIPLGFHMYRLEPDGRLVFTGANPAADLILKTDHRRFVGKTIEEAFPAAAESEIPNAYRRTAAQGTPWRADQVEYRDGEIAGAYQVDAFQTAPGRMVAAFLDITERKRADQALRASEERYRSFIANSSEAIWRIEWNPPIPVDFPPAEHARINFERAVVAECNDVFARQYGAARAEDVVGKHYSELLPNPDQGFFSFLEEFATRGFVIAGQETKETDPTGQIHFFTNNVVGIVKDGYLHRAWGTQADITKRKRAEQARAALYRIAELASGSEDVEALYAAIHQVVGELLDARNFYIALHHPANDTLVFPYLVDEKTENPGAIAAHRGLTGLVLRTGRPLLCSGAMAEQLEASGEISRVGERCVDWLGVPLKRGDATIGVLAVQSYSETVRFTEADRELLTFVSQHVATALERKRAADALRESEARYRKLVTQSPYGIAVLVDGRMAFANPAAVRILGAKARAEILGSHLVDFTLPDAVDLVKERLDRAARGEENPPLEHQWRRFDGTKCWMETSMSALTYGGRQAIQVMIRDLSEEKHAQARLTSQSAVTRILAEAADADHPIARLLDTLCNGLGWEVGELWVPDPAMTGQLALKGRYCTGAPIPELTPVLPAEKPSLPGRVWAEGEAVWIPDLTEVGDRSWQAVVRTGGLRSAAAFPTGEARGNHAVLAFMSRQAKPRDEADLRALTDIGQRIGQFFERKRVEAERERLQEALKRAAIEWRMTFDAVETVIVILDQEGRVIRLNAAAQRAAGLNYDRVLGQPIGEVTPTEPWSTAASVAASAGRDQAVRTTHIRDAADGRSWEIMAAPLTEPDQSGRLVIVVAQDVTRTVELQESVRRAETMVAMGSLVAGVAHEVRNPLFALSTNVDALEATLVEKSGVEEILDALRRSVARLSKLMEDLLEYGRTSGAALVPGPLAPVVWLAVKSCASLAQSRGVTLVDAVEDQAFRVTMDRDRLEQVFENLIENAVYHSPPGGSVRVEAEGFKRQEVFWVRVLVSDEGPGFRLDDLPRVFQPFFSRRRGGTGLGLSIVERIVQAHAGRVQAANHPAHGAVLTVELPCVK